MKFHFLLLILGGVLLEVIADILFKIWAIQSKSIYLSLGLAIYVTGTILWAYSLKFELLSKAISIFTICNLIAVILVGVIFFKEDVSTLSKVGIGLGIVSVILMQL